MESASSWVCPHIVAMPKLKMAGSSRVITSLTIVVLIAYIGDPRCSSLKIVVEVYNVDKSNDSAGHVMLLYLL